MTATASRTKPLLVVLSVRGGMVEDWDCPDTAAPVTFDFEPAPLTGAEEQHFFRRFNLTNQQGA